MSINNFDTPFLQTMLLETPPIKKIYIIGRGNVACHLKAAFDNSPNYRDLSVSCCNPHMPESIPTDGDLYIIAVKDDVIKTLSDRMPKVFGIVAHTSGSVSIKVLSRHHNYGVFYPLQTFSADAKLTYSNIPFLIEGCDYQTTEALANYGALISQHVKYADSDIRKKFHIASVFACNYVNHLWTLASEILHRDGQEFELLYPLIEETFSKMKALSPAKAQTGPASRGDINVINDHINQLMDANLKEIYKILADSIINHSQK